MSVKAAGKPAEGPLENAAIGVKSAPSKMVNTLSEVSGTSTLTTGDILKIVLSGVIAVGLYIGSFVVISQFVGSRDSQNQIKPEINKILGLTIGGSFCLFLALLVYFIKDPGNIIYIVLIMTCITLAISYSALAISAISK